MRRSERELERSVEDLIGDEPAVETWLREQLTAASFEYDVTAVDGVDSSNEVCVLETRDAKAYVPLEDVPDWIDPEEDLPVMDR